MTTEAQDYNKNTELLLRDSYGPECKLYSHSHGYICPELVTGGAEKAALLPGVGSLDWSGVERKRRGGGSHDDEGDRVMWELKFNHSFVSVY